MLDEFIYQALKDIVKLGGDNVIKNFEEKFKELQVEGCRKDSSSSTVMNAEDMEKDEDLPEDHYTESELKEMETLYMETESEARKRFQRNGPYRRSSFSRPSLLPLHYNKLDLSSLCSLILIFIVIDTYINPEPG